MNSSFSDSRRALLRKLSLLPLPLVGNVPTISLAAEANTENFLSIQVNGGWDISCFCDPKENIGGEKIITKWSLEDVTQEEGNIRYAPFAKNDIFFKKHYQKMLVVNGVDTQTNAHETGVMVSYTGRHAEGLPCFSALHALIYGGTLPLPYVAFNSSASFTENAISILQAQADSIIQISDSSFNNRIDQDILNEIEGLHAKNSYNMSNETGVLPINIQKRMQFYQSVKNADRLPELLQFLPSVEEIQSLPDLKRQILVSLALFKAGLTSTVDIGHGGYDSHTNNDSTQQTLLSELTDSINYLWDQAEIMGIKDDLFLMVGSDFSRTPYYNSGNGKDHHPSGSYIFMKENANFTNKTIGSTDQLQNPIGVDEKTLNSDGSGILLLPGHIQQSLRKYFGVDLTIFNDQFPLKVDSDIYIFS